MFSKNSYSLDDLEAMWGTGSLCKEFTEPAWWQAGNWVCTVLFKNKYMELDPQWMLLYAASPPGLTVLHLFELTNAFQSASLRADNGWLCVSVSYRVAFGCFGHLFFGSGHFYGRVEWKSCSFHYMFWNWVINQGFCGLLWIYYFQVVELLSAQLQEEREEVCCSWGMRKSWTAFGIQLNHFEAKISISSEQS